MTSTLQRETSVDHDDVGRADDTRLVELVMALSGCTARRALEQIRETPAQSPMRRVAYALAVLRSDVASTGRT
jgi:hypothetical protein